MYDEEQAATMASAITTATSESPKRWLTPSQIEGLISFATGIAVTAVLAYGWLHRADHWINPETGVGYALGILGGSLMLLLLVYPFRKRIRFLRAIGSVGFWFRFHMLLGLLGPLAILYHARYSWGALNSAVAMGAMLIVAGSGLIGRFLYSRVHRGYSGRKLEARAILTDMHAFLDNLALMGADGALVKDRLAPFEQKAVAAGASFWVSARAVLGIGLETRLAYYRLFRDIRSLPLTDNGRSREMLKARSRILSDSSSYLNSVRRAAEFAFYDRMLRLWHVLHLPLFFVLVATAIIHIVAVHMY
jgi:hypothetical protein